MAFSGAVFFSTIGIREAYGGIAAVLSYQPEGKADEILEADVSDHRVGSSYCRTGWD